MKRATLANLLNALRYLYLQLGLATLSVDTAAQAPMQQPSREALLAQLEDIITPEEIGLWPPAIGWWVLLTIIVGGLAYAVFYFTKRKRSQRYRKTAAAYLQAIDNQPDNEQFALQVLALLKRTSLHAYPHANMALANLHGHHWLHFLNASQSPPIAEQTLAKWADQLYSAAPEIERTALTNFAQNWIVKHRPMSCAEIEAVIAGRSPGHKELANVSL